MTADQPLWTPSAQRIDDSRMMEFARAFDLPHGDYADLWNWSIDNRETFWSHIWDWCGVIGEKGAPPYLADGDKMPGARFFPNAKLNYAENLLRAMDDGVAVAFRAEDKLERQLSWKQLNAAVSSLQQFLAEKGVGPGDRVAGYVANTPETLIAMLATTSLGAVWSSASPDFGVQGVLDRFGQIAPKVLFATEGYFYNGKTLDNREKIAGVLAALPDLAAAVILPLTNDRADISGLPKAHHYADLMTAHAPRPVEFTRMPFDSPLFIMFSSGTTGIPKCIVHGIGGTLLQHLKEHQLHCDIHPGDRVFYFTTCGWMMWNWLVTGLASGATLLLYDGSPFAPNGKILWDYTSRWGCSVFGTSAKYIDALNKFGIHPGRDFDLSALQLITSTGSPLSPEGFSYVYDEIKRDVHLASISGGTDIVSCFVLGNPWSAVWRGEIQGPGLGMAVDCVDDDCKPVRGVKGELVCRMPFPSMPVGFFNDPDGAKYHAAYFDRFDNVWCHGDFVEITPHDGMIIHGRSDATLNPGGVRIGTAEIYRVVEQAPEVVESIVIGQDWDHDVRVVLFVVLREGMTLDAALADRLKTAIRKQCTPRHVPAKIVQVTDIPRTKSGKITELAVRDVVHGRVVKNVEALANPAALALFKDRPELAS